MIFFQKIILKKGRLFCCLLFLVAACNHKSETADISKDKKAKEEKNLSRDMALIANESKMVRTGDLILRTGRDFTSDIMRRVSHADKTYSHCGIASLEHDTLFVYHAIGGEWNPDEKLRRDPFDFFCNPFENKGFGIFRYNLDDTQTLKLIAFARDCYGNEVKFDMQFNLDTDEKMYCSEFVYKAVKKAAGNHIGLREEEWNGKKFIAIDDLFKNPFCREIKRVKLQQQ